MAVDLAFSETGAGPPLVILPGLFGSKRNWASIARMLGDRHRVITADLRNHGESPWADRHDYPALADDVARLVERVAGGAAAVLGHSMGGKAAMMLALTQPALVERLVVVDIAPVVSTGTPIAYVRALRSLPLARFTRRSEVADALADVIPDRAVRNFLSLNAALTDGGLAWTLNLAALERDFELILGFPDVPPGQSYAGPTLFLTGGASEYVRPEHRPAIDRLFPAAAVATIAGAGHWVHADAPEAFVAAVTRFLDS
ncbi:MAG: alpha/beta fold hydrolase [Planctomycetota bacterium]